MAFIIPNAPDTSLKYANINQAEPDALDIEVLGLKSNWVRSGGVTTVSGGQISVTSGSVVIAGVPYSFSALSATTPTVSPSSRFDAVVARKSGATVSVVIVTGTNSSTNPTLPKSRSVLATDGLFNSTYNFDPATDVLLSTVYVDAGTVQSSYVVDKRIVSSQPVTREGTGVPTSQSYDVTGDIVVYSGTIYIRMDDGTWDTVPTSTDLGNAAVPVGAMFPWPGKGNPDSTYYKACNGQSLSKSAYPTLYSLLKGAAATSPYGEDASTFNLPDLINTSRTVMGGSQSQSGTTGGSDSVTLTAYNIPRHKHTVTVADHPAIQHTSAGATADRYTGPDGSDIRTRNSGAHSHSLVSPLDFEIRATSPNAASTYKAWYQPTTITPPSTTEHTSHTHGLRIDDHSELAHTVTSGEWGASPVSAFSILPPHYLMRWFIRVL